MENEELRKEKARQRSREWRANNKEKKSTYDKQWQEQNPEYKQTYYETHRQEMIDYKKQYNKLNKAKVAEYGKTYRHKNKDKFNSYNRKGREKRRTYIDEVKLKYGCCNPKCPCSYPLPPCCYDFHHIEEKEFDVSKGTKPSISMERLQKEINKCIVLCSVCHRMEMNGLLDAREFKRCNIDIP